MEATMFEVTLLIPVVDNAGVAFDAAHDHAFEAFVLGVFGGFSWRGTVAGGWMGGDQIYRDVTREFVLAVASIAQGADVAKVAAFAKTHYRQEAMYVRYLGQAEIL
jgi:hypothetical protein